MTSRSPDPDALPRYLASLWGRGDDAPRRGPKPTLTIHDIARAAVAIADEHGWEAVSMKAIAESLGMTTMSLYRYVESKDDVIDVMVDEAYGPSHPMPGETWQERIRNWAYTVTDRMRARPWLAVVPLSRPPVGPNTLSWTESGVRAFDGTPLTGQQKMNGLLLVDGFVRHHVRQSIQMGMLDAKPDGPAYESMLAVLVGPDTHPGITAAIAGMSPWDADDDFFTEQLEFGLAVLVDGLAALIDGKALR